MGNRANGNRLSEQNYCTYCPYRVKVEKHVLCNYRDPIHVADAMKTCQLLVPFESYRRAKQKLNIVE